MDARAFLRSLRDEVEHHPAVGHSLLGRCKIDPRAREDFKVFSSQHYPLVGTFTRYLELLLLSAPSSDAKIWLAKVLVDEYGERSQQRDHADHYRQFMRACGWSDDELDGIRLHPAVTGFIAEHLRLCTQEPFLVGLGAVGPGHEWAIPAMFRELIGGLRSAGFADAEIGYFTLHAEQDVDHGEWLEEALARFADGEGAQALIRRGCLASLAARERLWWGVADKVTAARMRSRFPGVASATSGSDEAELTLAEFRAGWKVSVAMPETVKTRA